MMETLLELDQSLSLAINQFHFSWLDPIMVFWSEKWVWIPLYALLLFLLWKNSDRNAFFLSLGMISVAIALSDQTASALLKPLFQRLRPCHQEALIPFLHLPKGCGGQFGFASSHSANCFCVFVLFERMLAKKMPAVRWLLFWALVTGWSRIYLGAHFLGDVLVGFVIGGFWAFISFTVLNRIYLLVKKSGIEKETP